VDWEDCIVFEMYKGRKYSITPKGYLRNNPMGLLHRVIWEEHYGAIPEGKFIDHINGNKTDNRLENLQLLTNTENVQRSSRGGVYKMSESRNKSRPWFAKRKVNYIIYNGYFGTKGGAIMFNNTCLL
jgi:hypothetical protein